MLLVYTPQITNRLAYALELVLRNILNVGYSISQTEQAFLDFSGPKIAYGKRFGKTIPYIPAHSILLETSIVTQAIPVKQWNSFPILFFTQETDTILPFDIFAASFFLATRYEEYLPYDADKHGRFPYQNSIAFQYHFLEKPLLNLWALALKKTLQKHYPALVFGARSFQFISTFDIDVAYAYKGRPLSRIIKASAKNIIQLDFKHFFMRWPVLLGFRKDPYDTYALQQILKRKYGLNQHYFILSGPQGQYDKNLSLKNASLQRNLTKLLSKHNSLGLHPSHSSHHDADKIKQEQQLLEEATGKKVISSRQHFLKLKFPETYRSLIQCGIEEDYSMGYPDHVGFRASICTPYPFYDLLADQKTTLMVYPLAMMDNTLKDYMALMPDEAIALTKTLIDAVHEVNGLFISIWHNHSLSNSGEWRNWLAVYEETIKYASAKVQ